jgi:hypothetical protein
MTAQKAQADVRLHRLHCALPGWGAAAEKRDAQDEFYSAAQARAWAGGDFDADHGLAFDGVGRQAHWGRARGPTGVEAAAARAPLLFISPLSAKKKRRYELQKSYRQPPNDENADKLPLTSQ